MRRSLTLAIGFLSGALVIARYYAGDVPVLAGLAKDVVNWRVIVAAFALGLGAVNLIQSHLRIVVRMQKNWDASLLLLLSLTGFSIVGILQGTQSAFYRWGWDYIYQPVYSGIASLLAFMITSASYRAFKVKDWQSLILMLSAVTVMLGQVGIGSLILKGLPGWAEWIMAVPNTAGMRGITIGGALGAVALSLRVLLGLERGYMGGGQQ